MLPTNEVTSSEVFQSRLAQAMGVTRVARVTGLDRTGVEVARAVRPGGHLLQVCDGKGLRFEQAAAGALLETAELWAAETLPLGRLRWGSRVELDGRPEPAWSAQALGSAGTLEVPRLWNDSVRCAWREATELHSGRTVWVPAQSVHRPPSDVAELGPLSLAWTRNGSGAHPDEARALLHALLEAAERDQLARALPEGWTAEGVRRRMLRPVALQRAAPRAAELAETLRERGFDVYFFDVTPSVRTPGSLRLPVGAAVLVDREEGLVPLTMGYACALRRDEALVKALLEAARARLRSLHGAREDVSPADREAARMLAAMCGRVRARRMASDMPDYAADADAPERGVRRVLKQLRGAGFTQVAVVSMDAPMPGLHVKRVVVPGMRISELP